MQQSTTVMSDNTARQDANLYRRVVWSKRPIWIGLNAVCDVIASSQHRKGRTSLVSTGNHRTGAVPSKRRLFVHDARVKIDCTETQMHPI